MSWAGFAKGFLPHMEKLSDTIAERNKLRMEKAKETAELQRKVNSAAINLVGDASSATALMQLADVMGYENMLKMITPNEYGVTRFNWRPNTSQETNSNLPDIGLNADSRTNPANQQPTATPEPDTLADETAAALGAVTPTANTGAATPSVDPVSVTPTVESPVTQNTAPTAQPTRVAATNPRPTERRVFETGAGAFVVTTGSDALINNRDEWDANNIAQVADQLRARGENRRAFAAVIDVLGLEKGYDYVAGRVSAGIADEIEIEFYNRNHRQMNPKLYEGDGEMVTIVKSMPDGTNRRSQAMRVVQNGRSTIVDPESGEPLDTLSGSVRILSNDDIEQGRREWGDWLGRTTTRRTALATTQQSVIGMMGNRMRVAEALQRSENAPNAGGALTSIVSNLRNNITGIISTFGPIQQGQVLTLDELDATLVQSLGLEDEAASYGSAQNWLNSLGDISEDRRAITLATAFFTYQSLAAQGQSGAAVAKDEFARIFESYGATSGDTILNLMDKTIAEEARMSDLETGNFYLVENKGVIEYLSQEYWTPNLSAWPTIEEYIANNTSLPESDRQMYLDIYRNIRTSPEYRQTVVRPQEETPVEPPASTNSNDTFVIDDVNTVPSNIRSAVERLGGTVNQLQGYTLKLSPPNENGIQTIIDVIPPE